MKNPKAAEIKREWRQIDAKGKILGRLSTEVAHILMGKNKPYYAPYMDCGDNVVVVNSAKVELSGKKEINKPYYRHSGYPGGLKVKTAQQVRSQKSEELIRHSVKGMLPKNKLARGMLKKLYIFPGSENPFQDKFSKPK
ncbi:MAG: 50S ribosomal protein L13 [Candidatus Curtissbacteria bacterium]|nr:50S ribosomal protein L13 [Candidatus Curtissbacteria bacterium]